jgi:hypothetical protein
MRVSENSQMAFLFKLLGEQQNDFALFGDDLPHSPHQGEDVISLIEDTVEKQFF